LSANTANSAETVKVINKLYIKNIQTKLNKLISKLKSCICSIC